MKIARECHLHAYIGKVSSKSVKLPKHTLVQLLGYVGWKPGESIYYEGSLESKEALKDAGVKFADDYENRALLLNVVDEREWWHWAFRLPKGGRAVALVRTRHGIVIRVFQRTYDIYWKDMGGLPYAYSGD